MIRTICTSMMLLALVATSTRSQAQLKRFSIGPYVETGIPVGDFSKTNNTGYGVGLNADIKLVAGLGVTGSVGYMRFSGKSATIIGPADEPENIKYGTLQAFPVRLGIKYKFPFPLLYVKVEGGTAHMFDDYTGTAGIIAPGIGIRFLGLDVEAKYEEWFKSSNAGFWGLKGSFNF
jgi:hypothetical protein